MTSTSAPRQTIRFLAAFGLYFGVLWLMWNSWPVYPIKLFVVLLHEASHGIMAVVTGGSIREISVNPMQGGFCRCPGGNAFLTLSAGYLGSALWGAGFLIVARGATRLVRVVMGAVGVLILALSVFYTRSLFAMAFGLVSGGLLLALARFFGTGVNQLVLTVLGMTSCLYTVLDIKSDVLDRPELRSDARMLAELTGIPTVVWGTLWIALAGAVIWFLIRKEISHTGGSR